MGRLKGSRNKKRIDVECLHAIEASEEVTTATLNSSSVEIKTEASLDLVLGIRRLKEGRFHGLWQIVEIKDGVETILIDATSKASVMNVARTEIARCV